MEVCLIKSPSPFLMDEKVFPPLGLMAVGTALKNMGHGVTIYDGPISGIPLGFDFYGVGPSTPEYPLAIEILKSIKARNRDMRVAIGGPHANVRAGECFSDGFDSVFIGDGESLSEDLFSPGFHYGVECSLDDYPIIDRSLLDINGYEYFINGKPATTLITSRGCPWRCAFCSKSSPTVRLRSEAHVSSEIRYLHDDLGYGALMFFDDTFILDKVRTVAICNTLKSLGIVWRCFVRADLIVRYGKEFADTLSDFGCVEVGMGIESGSDKILKMINKGESTNTINEGIGILNSSGIRVKGFFIVGLPGEDETTLEETRQFVSGSGLYDVDFTVFSPFPGSKIMSNKDRYDIHWDELNYSDLFYKGRPGEYKGNVSTSRLTADQILDARDLLEKTFKRWE